MRKNVIFAALGAMMLTAPAAWADLHDQIAVPELMSGWRGEDGLHHAALAIDLAPGWKTYWRRPGEGGIPPVFDWSASKNLQSVTVGFPVPDVYELNGMRSIGYTDRVVFPLSVRPEAGDQDITLNGDLLIGVCEEICIPMELRIHATLSADARTPSSAVQVAMEDHPMNAAEAGVSAVDCEIVPISDGLRLTANINVAAMARNEVAVVELPDHSIWITDPIVTRSGQTLSAEVDMVPGTAQPFALSRQDVRITLFGGGQAIDIQGCG